MINDSMIEEIQRRMVTLTAAAVSGEGADMIATVNCHTTICIRRRYELVAKER